MSACLAGLLGEFLLQVAKQPHVWPGVHVPYSRGIIKTHIHVHALTTGLSTSKTTYEAVHNLTELRK